MILKNKFDGYLRVDPHDHIREFLAICDMFKYGETQSEAVKLLIFPFSLCDEAKTWFNELNEESITSWEQMGRAFINRFFPPSLFNRLLLEIRNFSQLVCESLIDAWLRLKNMLQKCHAHGLTKGAIIQIFYHGLDKPTQGILDVFLYKKELQDMHKKYNELREENASKNHLNDDTPMCERHEANYIQSEDYQNQDSHNSFSHQSHHDPNDSEKLPSELNNDVKNDLEDFKRRIRSMRNVHWKLFTRDDGSGPDWLFDIDLLTKSMNYEPVTAGNQTNRNAGIKDNVDDERNGQEKERGASNKEGDQSVQDLRAELDNLLVQQKQGYANSTNRVSIEDTINFLNTGIFSGAYDDEDVGAEADLNNLETTMNVSLIPTTRIYKDHLKEQIIGDLLSAPQTRRMTNSSQEHVMKVWRLVDLPKGKHAIGTKWVYRNKKDEIGIVVRNKARLVAHGYTQEEGIYYDKVFAPVARIEAIRLFLDYASFMGFIVYQMYAKSVFLYGIIEEEVYVCQPPSFEDLQFTDKVYKVEKALYGLHQAPRACMGTERVPRSNKYQHLGRNVTPNPLKPSLHMGRNITPDPLKPSLYMGRNVTLDPDITTNG
ncbi:reverse transcriptase domain-containing protein [Tanacetum coccineum]